MVDSEDEVSDVYILTNASLTDTESDSVALEETSVVIGIILLLST